MKELIIYCKSFSRDVRRVEVLLESVLTHNVDNIPFYVSVPAEDVKLFTDQLGTGPYTLITDEEIVGDKFIQDWKTQQIIKSSFWKLNNCHNWMMVDSDSYFIRDFRLDDFIVDKINHVPYTVMHEQKDLFSWTPKNTKLLGFDPQKSFEETRKPVMEIFGRKGRLYDFGPGPVIFNAKIWKSLHDEYLTPNGLTFQNLIETMPSEFSWYGEWLLFKHASGENIIPLWPIEPIFKFFHYLQEYQEFKDLGYTIEHWKKNYFGVTMQSSSGLPLKY